MLFNGKSICLFVWDEQRDEGAKDDFHIKPESPILYVPNVFLHSLLHLPHLFRLSSASTHLRPSRDAGEAEMPHHVLVDDLAVLGGVSEHVRPWSDDAHVSLENVEELRELVDVGTAYEIAEWEFPRVVLGGLQFVGVGVDVHGTELDARERLPVEARSLLLEEERPRALPLDDEGDDGNEREHEDTHNGAYHDVEKPLDEPVERM